MAAVWQGKKSGTHGNPTAMAMAEAGLALVVADGLLWSKGSAWAIILGQVWVEQISPFRALLCCFTLLVGSSFSISIRRCGFYPGVGAHLKCLVWPSQVATSLLRQMVAAS